MARFRQSLQLGQSKRYHHLLSHRAFLSTSPPSPSHIVSLFAEMLFPSAIAKISPPLLSSMMVIVPMTVPLYLYTHVCVLLTVCGIASLCVHLSSLQDFLDEAGCPLDGSFSSDAGLSPVALSTGMDDSLLDLSSITGGFSIPDIDSTSEKVYTHLMFSVHLSSFLVLFPPTTCPPF